MNPKTSMQSAVLNTQKEVKIHVLYWILLGYFNFFEIVDGKFVAQPLSLFSITWALVYVLTFYWHYLLIMPRIVKPFNLLKAFLGFCLTILFFVGIRFLLEQLLAPLLFQQSNYHSGIRILEYVEDNFLYATHVLILSTTQWTIIYLIRLFEWNKTISEENKNAQIKFLQAQTNPHFLYNSLNNIYSMVYFNSEKSLEAIEKLSLIMRYTTYSSELDRVKIQEEIAYVRHIIDLENFRFEDGNVFIWKERIQDGNIEVPPHLFSPFIENAIKHGNNSPQKPVECVLSQNENQIVFTSNNTIRKNVKIKNDGIGLKNLKKRLDLYYGEQYQLDIRLDEDRYSVKLQFYINGSKN